MNKPLTTLLLLLALALAAPSVAFAQDKAAEREAVQMLLMPYDKFPAADDFKRVSKDPRAVILAVWRDKKSSEILRLQALDALSLFPNEEVRALYLEILSGDWGKEAPREAHRAINGLMLAFGESAVMDVAPLLTHADVQVRLTAAHALSKFGGESGRQLLLAHRDDETDKIVRESIDQLTRRIR